jgi:hypothetical protein
MKTLYTTIVLSLLLLVLVVPGVMAISFGEGLTPEIITEDFEPRVWFCDDRVVYDDATEPGRTTNDGEEMVERKHNYAFEGEQIHWTVLVMDKNKIDQNIDVFGTIGPSQQGPGNDIEVNCNRIGFQGTDRFNQCNARIQQEHVEWDEDLMDFFDCTLTVETPESMAGEFWVTVEAEDADGLLGAMVENEYWFFNPIVSVGIDGELVFDEVRPGTDAYSETILIRNEAEDGSGVILDMFISGTDFYDSSSSGARCPTTNQLQLDNLMGGDDFTGFRYFATNGAYSTYDDDTVGRAGPTGTPRTVDSEGYVNIGYGIAFNDPNPFYDGFEIIQDSAGFGGYYFANHLTPGGEMAVTFKLSLPEPCNGDFDSGSIFFWGEAI